MEKGYADMVFVPRNGVNKSAIVVEFKYNKTADAAIEQIKIDNMLKALRLIKAMFCLLALIIMQIVIQSIIKNMSA